jgi:hypothetical protein
MAACFSGRTRMSFEAFLFDTLDDVVAEDEVMTLLSATESEAFQ